MMLKMKKVILLFAMTMKSYGFGIGSLYTLLQNFRYFIFLSRVFFESWMYKVVKVVISFPSLME